MKQKFGILCSIHLWFLRIAKCFCAAEIAPNMLSAGLNHFLKSTSHTGLNQEALAKKSGNFNLRDSETVLWTLGVGGRS